MANPPNRRLQSWQDQMNARTHSVPQAGILGWGVDKDLGEKTIFSKTAEVDPEKGGFKTDTAAGRRLNATEERERIKAERELNNALKKYEKETNIDLGNVKDLTEYNAGRINKGAETGDLSVAEDVRKGKAAQLGQANDSNTIPAEGALKTRQLQEALRTAAAMQDALLNKTQGEGFGANVHAIAPPGSIFSGDNKPSGFAQPAASITQPASIFPSGAITGGGTVAKPAGYTGSINMAPYQGIINPAVNPAGPAIPPGQAIDQGASVKPPQVTPFNPTGMAPTTPQLSSPMNNPSLIGGLIDAGKEPQINPNAGRSMLNPNGVGSQQPQGNLIEDLIRKIIADKLTPKRQQF